MVLFNIDQHEKEILAVDYINKRIETKDKWNQINVLNMQSMSVANWCMPLLHMSKSYILIKETNQRINEFTFGYMIIPNLFKNRYLKNKWKCVSKTHLVQIPLLILIKYYRKNTRVLALVIFYESGKTNPRKIFRVLSCVIYNIIDKCVCINYLGNDKFKISHLKIACTGSSKHDGMDYNNLFGIGIPYILLNMLSCHGFLKNNDSVVILKCPNRMS